MAAMVMAGTADAQSRKKSTGGKKKKGNVALVSVTKGDVKDYGDHLTTQVFTARKGKDNEVKVEYPIGGNPVLVSAIRNMIKESLNDKFTGSLDNPEALLRGVLKDKKDMKPGSDGESLSQEIVVDYSNPSIVTFTDEGYVYMGGAHGMPWKTGKTFLTTDGSTLEIDMLPAYSKMKPYIRKALAKEYGVNDLGDVLFDGSGPDEYPQTIYVTDKGLTFIYQAYEIAPYSAGMPTAVVPLTNEVISLLPEAAKRFVTK